MIHYLHPTKQARSPEQKAQSLILTAQTYSSLSLHFRSAFFWDVTQCGMVDSYRRFGTTYLSHLQRSSSPRLLATLRCVKSHNSADLIYTAEEASNQAIYILFLIFYCQEI